MSETMADFGLLNGQPLGPELPASVPCEVCGHPVYCTERAVVYRDDEPTTIRGVFEQTFPPLEPLPRPWSWALVEHRCLLVRL